MSTLMTNPFYANHLITLREAFPDSEPEVVEDVLRSSQGDLTVAFNVMLAMSDAKQSLPSISSSSQHSVPALPRRATTGRSTGRSNLHSSRESIGHPIPPPNPPPTQLFSQLLSQLSERNHNRPIYTPLPPHLPYVNSLESIPATCTNRHSRSGTLGAYILSP
ncbi:hypothetical protein BDF14DRAFT_1847965 [Spinellus fusiger]|nr:hypothetical protein BDF14DRAFT_1847965 [Spinellus fusiger]